MCRKRQQPQARRWFRFHAGKWSGKLIFNFIHTRTVRPTIESYSLFQTITSNSMSGHNNLYVFAAQLTRTRTMGSRLHVLIYIPILVTTPHQCADLEHRQFQPRPLQIIKKDKLIHFRLVGWNKNEFFIFAIKFILRNGNEHPKRRN